MSPSYKEGRNEDRHHLSPPSKRQRECSTTETKNNTSSTRSKDDDSQDPAAHTSNGGIDDSSAKIDSLLENLCGETSTLVVEGDEPCSLESALAVPAEILFRRVGEERDSGNDNGGHRQRRKFQKRPLLTRQEMEQFLRLTLVAQEMDALVHLSESVLSRRRFARNFRRNILRMQQDAAPSSDDDSPKWKNPWLVTLGPVLDVLEQRRYPLPIGYATSHRSPLQSPGARRLSDLPGNEQQEQAFAPTGESILYHVNEEMTRLCQELYTCGVHELERSAEQNRSLVVSLTDILGYEEEDCNLEKDRPSAVRVLATEKQALSRLQDHLSKRVRSLLKTLCFSRVPPSSEKTANETDIPSKETRFDDQCSSSSTIVRTGGNKRTVHYDDHKDQPSPQNELGRDDSSLLSFEEATVPLNLYCEQLFGALCPNGTRTTHSAGTKTPLKEKNITSKEFVEPVRDGTGAREKRTRDDQHSQRTVGVAALMMELGTEPTHPRDGSNYNLLKSAVRLEDKHKDDDEKVNNAQSHPAGNVGRKVHNDDDDDDDSFLEDPPSEDEEGKNKRHEKKAKSKDTTKHSPRDSKETKHRDIFDVIDILTPQQDEEPQQQQQQHLSSLSSQSQTAAEALTRMGRGNSFRY